MIGGGTSNKVWFSAKSDIRRVADMIIRRRGYEYIVNTQLQDRMNLL